MNIQTKLADIEISGIDKDSWNCCFELTAVEQGVEDLKISLKAKQAAVPTPIVITWSVPMLDMGVRWTPVSGFNRFIGAEWQEPVVSNLADSSPVMSFFGYNSINGLTFAVSEALRQVKITGGVSEYTNCICCRIELFTVPEAPIENYETILRLDARKVFYAEAIGDITDWFAEFEEYKPSSVPAAAYEPLYSTWYGYHQNLFDHEIEKECEQAIKYGMKGIIVDDGWQTDDNNSGYRYCGDWQISRKRFPDMAAHVKKVHEMGLKYLVWFSIPFAGDDSEACKKFAGKFLFHADRLKTYVFDPRFPEVREYLINIYENAVREWGIDGLKLDFIEQFHIEGEDPAIKENYAGRDIKLVPEAVDVLLSETMRRLRKINSDILIEFRQQYIGPAIRKYGNMFRAGDCPADALSNRTRTLDLRLTSGNTAVHSDMLEWNLEDSAESAALQILSIIFSVPQISVRLAELPERHKAMLKFWLEFCTANKDVLLHGLLKPLHPELNYPLVIAENVEKTVIAVYNSGQCSEINSNKTTWLVNATRSNQLVINVVNKPVRATKYDVCGNATPVEIPAGLQQLPIPASGLLKLEF